MSRFLSLRVLCVSVVTLFAIGYFARHGYQVHVQRQNQLADWEAEQDLEHRLARVVEMQFRRTPSLQEWLAEWSRQSTIRIGEAELDAVQPNLQRRIELSLGPMPAQVALQTLVRSHDLSWSVVRGEVVLTSVASAPELRAHLLPPNLTNQPGFVEIVRRTLGEGAKQVHEVGGELQVLAPRSLHVEVAVIIARMSKAMDQASELRGDDFALNVEKWEPILIDDDPAAMDRTLAALQQPLDAKRASLPLAQLAAELNQTLNVPVVLDADLFELPELRVHIDERPPRSISERMQQRGMKALPVASGRTIKLVSNRSVDRREKITYAYPVADLIAEAPGRNARKLAQLVLMFVPGEWYNFTTRESEGIEPLGPLLIVTAEAPTHQSLRQLLSTLRIARSGSQGSATRSVPRLSPSSRIEAALDKSIALDYADVPLPEVLADLSRRLQIPIELDGFAGDAGISGDTRIQCHLPAAPLGENLQRLLSPYRLTFGVHEDVLLVISQLDALVLRSEPRFQYEVLNVNAIRERGRNVSAELAELLMSFDDSFEWQRSGGRGRCEAWDRLLILSNHAACLNRVQRVFRSVERQAVVNPDEVRDRALSHDSAPLLIDPPVTDKAARWAHERQLWMTLSQRINAHYEDKPVGQVLLDLARQHQLPIVFPGSQLVDVNDQEGVSLYVNDTPLIQILEQLLPADSDKHWIIGTDGTLQTWDPNFLPAGGRAEHWLFDVSDLVAPAGAHSQEDLLLTLLQQFPADVGAEKVVRIEPRLGRFIVVRALPGDCRVVQETLHALRLGKLPPLNSPPLESQPRKRAE